MYWPKLTYQMWDGTYVHNLFLELIIQFGIIIGSFISVLICVLVYRGINCKDLAKRDVYILYISCGFGILMISSTMLNCPMFWVLIGMALADTSVGVRLKGGFFHNASIGMKTIKQWQVSRFSIIKETLICLQRKTSKKSMDRNSG